MNSGITRDQIEARLAQLKTERDAAIANINAYNGAIQDCEHWLSQMPVEIMEGEVRNDD
mgnify:CR=1 FL=1